MEETILDIAIKVLAALVIAYFLRKAFLETRGLLSDIRNRSSDEQD
jgi:hypothetical protein